MQDNPYMMLAKVFLPSEMTEYFDLTDVRTDEYGGNHVFTYSLMRRRLLLKDVPMRVPMVFMRNPA